MENLGDVIEYVQSALNKDQKSGRISVPKIRTAIKVANEEYYVDIRTAYEENSIVTDETRSVLKTIGDPINPTPLVPDANGYIDFPEDYRYFSSLNHLYTKGAGCDGPVRKRVPVEMLTDAEFQVRSGASLKGPSNKYPLGTVQNNKILVLPRKSRYELTYWRETSVPFYDYIVVNGAIQYLPPGEVHDGSNVEVAVGTLSRSVEFEWHELKRVADKILRSLSVNKRAEMPYQEAGIEMAKQSREWTSNK